MDIEKYHEHILFIRLCFILCVKIQKNHMDTYTEQGNYIPKNETFSKRCGFKGAMSFDRSDIALSRCDFAI